MPKYVIEREVPGAGDLTDAQLREFVAKIGRGLERNGPGNPVAPQLRHRQQSVLRVPRSRRSHRAGARQARRPGLQSRLGRAPADRPIDRGVSASPIATRPPAARDFFASSSIASPAACPSLPATPLRCWQAPAGRAPGSFPVSPVQRPSAARQYSAATRLPRPPGAANAPACICTAAEHAQHSSRRAMPRLCSKLLKNFQAFAEQRLAPPHNSLLRSPAFPDQPASLQSPSGHPAREKSPAPVRTTR